MTWCRLKQLLTKSTTGAVNRLKRHAIQVCHKRNMQTSCQLCTSRVPIASNLFANPIDELQPYMQVPIIPATSVVFQPSIKEMEEAQPLFQSHGNHHIRFLRSVVDQDQLPEYDLPEFIGGKRRETNPVAMEGFHSEYLLVAFLGRSNVGKSTLLQAMFREVPDVEVRTSKKPGHTRAMNLFQVGDAFTVLDMPGYGFNMPSHFLTSVEQYLRTRKNLNMIFLLCDGQLGLTVKDQKFLKKLVNIDRPFTLVLTKIDKIGKHQLLKNLLSVLRIRDASGPCCLSQPFLVSAMSGQGIALLQTFIAYVTGCIEVEGG